MNFLPTASGTRPRVACEIAPQGVTAARSDSPAGPLAAVASVALEHGALSPGLKPGNIVDRVATVAATRRALEGVGARPNARNADITIVIPDGACRVLLLDFDALPNKLSEAMPIIRFRLKKLVPFDSDDAMVSFQVLSHSKQAVRVLAVAMPRDVLAEYEGVAREAGFEPGAVLPSTLASLAGLEDGAPTLLVNVSALSVTTAITREGILLLHRTVDLQLEPVGVPVNMPPALFEPSSTEEFAVLPLVDVEETEAEWAAQEALPEHGRNPYAAMAEAETAVQNEDGITALPVPPVFANLQTAEEPAPVSRSPYAQPTVQADLYAESHNSMFIAPTSIDTLTDPATLHSVVQQALGNPVEAMVEEHPHGLHAGEALPPAEFAREVAQAVNVAAAYFEDTLAEAPRTVLSGGTLSAGSLQRVLEQEGVADADGLRVKELVTAEHLAADAVSARVARGSLAAVVGALRG